MIEKRRFAKENTQKYNQIYCHRIREKIHGWQKSSGATCEAKCLLFP